MKTVSATGSRPQNRPAIVCLLALTNLLHLGKWKGPVSLPMEKKLESLSNTLVGDDSDQFLDFVLCLLCWLPEERFTAGQAYYHPWLRETY